MLTQQTQQTQHSEQSNLSGWNVPCARDEGMGANTLPFGYAFEWIAWFITKIRAVFAINSNTCFMSRMASIWATVFTFIWWIWFFLLYESEYMRAQMVLNKPSLLCNQAKFNYIKIWWEEEKSKTSERDENREESSCDTRTMDLQPF